MHVKKDTNNKELSQYINLQFDVESYAYNTWDGAHLQLYVEDNKIAQIV